MVEVKERPKKRIRDPLKMRAYREKWRKENPEKWKLSYTESRRKKIEAEPWYKMFICMTSRCFAKSHHYYKKGIKCFLGAEDIKSIWFRDKAYLLERPSIDRIDPDGNYTLENTRMIEFSENMKRKRGRS